MAHFPIDVSKEGSQGEVQMQMVSFDKKGFVHLKFCARRTGSQWCLLRRGDKKIKVTDHLSSTRN